MVLRGKKQGGGGGCKEGECPGGLCPDTSMWVHTEMMGFTNKDTE